MPAADVAPVAEYIERSEIFRLWKNIPLTASVTSLSAAIHQTPAADVAPVRHGEWLLRHKGYGHYWECSACHTNPSIYVTKDTKFCPNCGAKMDGDE